MIERQQKHTCTTCPCLSHMRQVCTASLLRGYAQLLRLRDAQPLVEAPANAEFTPRMMGQPLKNKGRLHTGQNVSNSALMGELLSFSRGSEPGLIISAHRSASFPQTCSMTSPMHLSTTQAKVPLANTSTRPPGRSSSRYILCTSTMICLREHS